jgi:hypothetical protein
MARVKVMDTNETLFSPRRISKVMQKKKKNPEIQIAEFYSSFVDNRC